ncbi:hypothetical protein L4C54_01935 [Vibrio lamellibrachiae]|uniref:hypothetical protein n=1 Tax=Vibrio lamellibrachiae TaxID=2910253 RepID=UPI003D0F9279
MKTLKIETFTLGEKEDTIKVPLALAKLAVSPFLKRLNSDQAEIVTTAMKSNDFLGVILEVEEHQSNEKIIFSIV